MTLTSEEILIVAPCNAQVSALIEAMLPMRDRIGTRGLLSGAAGSRRNLLGDILEPGGGSLGAAGEIVNIRAPDITEALEIKAVEDVARAPLSYRRGGAGFSTLLIVAAAGRRE